MREETEEWLSPMGEELQRRIGRNAASLERAELFEQASMPGSEADDPMLDALERCAKEKHVEGMAWEAIDWIRFGQLLRIRLGWDDYPDLPEGCT